MNNSSQKQLSEMDILIETHVGLDRQGPGSAETTLKALGFLDKFDENSQILDLGCGTGGQTIVIAQNIAGNITGVDQCPAFIEKLNDKAKNLNLYERVKGIVGSIANLSFPKESIDLMWSEGAIDNIGFEKGINYWKGFLIV